MVITNLDVSDARESESVAAVITAADLIAAGISMDLKARLKTAMARWANYRVR